MESLIGKKIQELIEKSALSPAEQKEFVSILSRATDEELENMIMLFSESASWIEIMYHNYKDKEEALKEKDEGKLQDIIAGEEKLLQTL